MKKIISIALLLIASLVFINDHAGAYTFLDNKLEIYGEIETELDIRTKQDARDVRYSSLRVKWRPELRYKIFEDQCSLLNFYFNGNYFWDFGLNINGDLRDAVRLYAGQDHFKDYRRPLNPNSVIKDMYLNYKFEEFQFRVGKQLVSWGETASARVADIINPMDYTYYTNNPVWDEYKIGLWMARLFYTPKDMWQDLSFEMVLIPFEFMPEKSQVQGVSPFNFTNNNVQQLIYNKRLRDAPDWSIDNFEVGARVRGFWRGLGTGVDWTLSNFYSRQDIGLIKSQEAYNEYTWLFLLKIPPKNKIFRYPFYNATAFTWSTTIPGPDITIGGESSYKSNQMFAYGPTANTSYINKRKGLLDNALKISRNFYIPGFSDNVHLGNSSEPLYAELTTYYSKLLNMDHNSKTGDQIWWTSSNGSHSSKTNFTLVLMTNLYNGKLTPFFLNTYDVQGFTTQNYALSYQPNYHWSWMMYYMQFSRLGIVKYQNQVGLIMKYAYF